MDYSFIPENPYLLLTPGPLSTTKSVKAAMLRDWCTWDNDYNSIVQYIREKLVALAGCPNDGYTSVLMQGSGTFSVESVIGSAISSSGRLLVLVNGAYGARIAKIASMCGIDHVVHDSGEISQPDLEKLDAELSRDARITHVAVVHVETTTGIINPVEKIAAIVKAHKRMLIVDAMSSFGGIPIDMKGLDVDFLISSANKCIQGVPGFGFIIAKRSSMEGCAGNAHSHSLDLYDQWNTMERGNGKWRFTSPTHTVRAFRQALDELEEEGGIKARSARYRMNNASLVKGMRALGFRTLLEDPLRSPIITSFLSPTDNGFVFDDFYSGLKKHGFVIYPGKITAADTFRIGNIGNIQSSDIVRLLAAVEVVYRS